MNYLDWIVLIGTMAFIVIYGIWKTRKSQNIESYLKGNSDKWYTVGLSVMATQASAITFLSATGQGYESGMGFVQVYFGLPLALILICAVFIPIFYKLNVYTAYEYLESRFDLKTRLLTASLFLASRAFAAGITIYAPSIVLSTLFNWDLNVTNIVIGVLVVAYTVAGGNKAVSITQKQQMAIIFLGMFIAFYLILEAIPDEVGFAGSIRLAGASEKLEIINYDFDPNTRYTIWSGLLGGFFLSLSYFGTDQSQVQRYINATNTTQSRMGLIFNAILKIPMQFFILSVGVLLFAFYQFQAPPVYFNQQHIELARSSGHGDSVAYFEGIHLRNFEEKKALALQASSGDTSALSAYTLKEKEHKEIKTDFRDFLKRNVENIEVKDTDYVFLSYILKYFPHGLIGLLLAVILFAAMSSTSAEISALSSTATVDFFKRLSPGRSARQELLVSKALMLLAGLIAISFALTASLFENLIQLVNIIGSLFYGTILGVFVCGFFIRHIKGNAVFLAALVAELIVVVVYLTWDISFLWLNPIGTAAVILFGFLFQSLQNEKTTA